MGLDGLGVDVAADYSAQYLNALIMLAHALGHMACAGSIGGMKKLEAHRQRLMLGRWLGVQTLIKVGG